MASTWLNSWGSSWGNSWGAVLAEDEGGGGGPSKKKKRARGTGWANERERHELSLRRSEQEIPKPRVQEAPITTPDYAEEFVVVEQIRSDLNALQREIEARRIEAEAQGVVDAQIEAYLLDEEEALTAVLLVMEQERQAFHQAFNW